MGTYATTRSRCGRPKQSRQRREGRIGLLGLPSLVSAIALALVTTSCSSMLEPPELATLETDAALDANMTVFVGNRFDVGMSGLSMVWAGGLSTVWAGGMSTVWAGGLSTVWAGGLSTVWAGGQYAWMPENTSVWERIRLREGHLLARNLGNGVTVAVIDTGLDLAHPAFSEALVAPEDMWDFFDDDPFPHEEGRPEDVGYGHGSSVAGIIRQIAPRATVMPLRVLGVDGVGDAGDVASAILWAVSHGADVINLSLGAAQPVQSIQEALRIATASGAIVVSSAGDGDDRQVTYPASKAAVEQGSDQLLSVTSVDEIDQKSDFSTYSRTKVELAAPGEDIYGPFPVDRKAPWSGTSMSAAVAAGVIALAIGEEAATVPRSGLTGALMASSDDIYADGLNQLYIEELGAGRVNVERFMLQLLTVDAEGHR